MEQLLERETELDALAATVQPGGTYRIHNPLRYAMSAPVA